MSNDNGADDGWAFSEANDWKAGRHRRDSHIPVHAGEVADREAERTMTAMALAFERAARDGRLSGHAPASFPETDTARDLRVGLGADTFGQAVEQGDSHRLRHFVGSAEDVPDVSGLQVLERVREIVTDDPLVLYIYGPQGSGKTMFGALLTELWGRWVGGDVASNLRTIDRAEWIDRWHRLDDWMYVDEEDRLEGRYDPKLYFMDEANAVLGGQGTDGWNAKTKMAELGYKIRHYGGNLIVVGHDGKDIAPSIRELCTIAAKTDLKTVQFYESIKERTPRDPLTPELSGVPLPDKAWQPHTRDDADFHWTDEDGETPDPKQIATDSAIYTAIKGMESGLSSRDTAKFVPFSHTWVQNRYNEWHNEGEHDDVLDSVTEITA